MRRASRAARNLGMVSHLMPEVVVTRRVRTAYSGALMSNRDPWDDLPDVRDGLPQRERIVLQCLYDLQ
jgi:hypothetical protein